MWAKGWKDLKGFHPKPLTFFSTKIHQSGKQTITDMKLLFLFPSPKSKNILVQQKTIFYQFIKSRNNYCIPGTLFLIAYRRLWRWCQLLPKGNPHLDMKSSRSPSSRHRSCISFWGGLVSIQWPLPPPRCSGLRRGQSPWVPWQGQCRMN